LPLLVIGVIAFAATTVVLRVINIRHLRQFQKLCIRFISQKFENDATGIFQDKNNPSQNYHGMASLPTVAVLGANTTSGEKHIYIDLSTQTLYAYQGTDPSY